MRKEVPQRFTLRALHYADGCAAQEQLPHWQGLSAAHRQAPGRVPGSAVAHAGREATTSARNVAKKVLKEHRSRRRARRTQRKRA